MKRKFYEINANNPNLIEICRKAKIRLAEQVVSKTGKNIIIWNRGGKEIPELANETAKSIAEIKKVLKGEDYNEGL